MTGPNSPHYFLPKKAPKILQVFSGFAIFTRFSVASKNNEKKQQFTQGVICVELGYAVENQSTVYYVVSLFPLSLCLYVFLVCLLISEKQRYSKGYKAHIQSLQNFNSRAEVLPYSNSK